MVAFSSHEYIFTGSRTHNSFNLLKKYYNGLKCSVECDGGKPVEGHAMSSFFDQFNDPTKTYRVVFNRVWDSLAFINAMPEFRPLEKKDVTLSPAGIAAVDAIRSVLSDRIRHNGHELFLARQISVSPSEFHTVLSECHLEKYHVTRFYIEDSVEPRALQSKDSVGVESSGGGGVEPRALQALQALVVIDDRHCMRISLENVSDNYFGVFDLEDGFVYRAFGGNIPQGWNEQFRAWRERFEKSDGASWDEPIIASWDEPIIH
jgi:hypothetical protein